MNIHFKLESDPWQRILFLRIYTMELLTRAINAHTSIIYKSKINGGRKQIKTQNMIRFKQQLKVMYQKKIYSDKVNVYDFIKMKNPASIMLLQFEFKKTKARGE